MNADDAHWMRLALDQAKCAALNGEVPVGAVLVASGRLVASAYNHTLVAIDPTAHAEIEAIRLAAAELAAPRLPDTVLYVTLEPCLMCLGAAVHARIERIVFGAPDPKVGATGLWRSIPIGFQGLNHRLEIDGGLLAGESAELLRMFFRDRR